MKKRFFISYGLCAAMLLAAWITTAKAPSGNGTEEPLIITQQASEENRIRENTDVFQTMHFERCGHQVERRIKVPGHLVGAGFDAVSAYYDVWEIQNMTADTLEMERYIDLYCPLHKVIFLDRTGQMVLAENRYGDGMAILKVLEGKISEDELRNKLIAGIGFDSEEEAMMWLAEQGMRP